MLSDVTGSNLVLVLISIVIALSIHEAMHGYVAHWLGDTTAYDAGRLTLNPLKHIDIFTTVLLPMVLILAHVPPIFAAKPVPFNPDRLKYDEFGAALVGVAGPLTNLVLAVIAAIIFRSTALDTSSMFYNFLIIFTEVNIGFFIFNLIPVPPLDGSRLLYAFAPEPLQEFMQQLEAAGFLPMLLLIFVIFQFASTPIVNLENNLLTLLLG